MTWILLGAACVFLRVAPIWRERDQGCDAYYFLLTAEAFRRQRRLPVKLPGYYLAETAEQTYPPGFTVFLSLLPERWLHRFYWLLNPLLDAANLVALGFFAEANFGWYPALLAALLYLVIPDLQTENATLTSRALGNLMLSGYMVGYLEFEAAGDARWLLLTLAVGAALLMTHKLTTQFLLVLSVGLSLLTWRPWPLALLLATVAVTALVFRRAYATVLRGHYDVVTFWHKHFYERGGHLVYDSPVYANPAKSPKGEKISQKPWWLLARHALLCNPLLLGLPVLYGAASARPLTWALWSWGALCLLTMFATLFVPALRQFGQGHRYAKMAAFPLSALTAAAFASADSLWLRGALAALAALCLLKTAQAAYVLWATSHTSPIVVDPDLRKAFQYINDNGLDYIFCINLQPSEALVYYCRKHVLWGGHHYGHNTMLVDFYPTLKKPLEDLAESYGIRYLLLNDRYVAAEDLGLGPGQMVWRDGRYSIYSLREGAGGRRAGSPAHAFAQSSVSP